MSFAAYIAFYSNNIQELNDKGLVCKRAKGNEYTISDDRYVLEFYNAHKDDDILIREQGAMAAYKSCL